MTQPIPDSLNAVLAAPDHHRVVLDNERVRVLDTRIAPGDRTPVHTHRWPAVLHVLSWSPFVRYGADGTVMVDSRTIPALQQPPNVLWSEPLEPHALENVGSVDLHILCIELKPL
ncbi:hypothetical protein GCM10023189_27200 [Nibrella saemangeumensis]|uniref:Cupin domain-containing protein n=1 Tax=Nibrella saemangeumensis TaxID=1084526 RepID=A0ABP8MYE4_9BACT